MVNQATSLSLDLKWFPRPNKKCDGNFYEKKVLLLVNWFKFNEKIYDREYYEYHVDMQQQITKKGKDGKVRHKVSEVPIPERAVLFWLHLRHEARGNPNLKIEDYVFDGKDTVYSVHKHNQPITTFLVDPVQKNTKYAMTLSLREGFRLNFSREDPSKDEEANRSYKFLKVVLTQKVRYTPEVNEKVRIEFAKNFVYERNSILRVPESFHDPNRFDYSLEIAPRIESWLGIYIGIKELYDGEPVANFGIVEKLFYNAPKMSLLDYILLIVDSETREDEVRNSKKRQLKNENLTIPLSAAKKIDHYLQGLKLKCTEVWEESLGRMAERHLIFNELSSVNSFEAMVKIKARRDVSSREIPIFEIYKNNRKHIEFPYLPLVKVKSGKKEYHVPIEHLEVHEKPQQYRSWIDKVMQDKVIKAATRKPNEYKTQTIEMLKELELTSEDLNFVDNFGLSTELKMITCVGKVLKEPKLVNKENKSIPMTPVIRGFQEKHLNIVPEKELCFALFILRNEEAKHPCLSENEAFDFYEALVDGCDFRGMRIGEHENRRARSILQDNSGSVKYGFYKDVTLSNGACSFQAAANDAKAMFDRLTDRDRKALVFIVVSDLYRDAYGFIKHYCDVNLGVVSQYVTAAVAKRKTRSICYNLALKINAKLGGVNQELNFSENAEMSLAEKEERKQMPLKMYVGIDVTHPTTGSGIDFSIAAVVASINPSGTMYRNMIVTQEECTPGERPVAHGRERTDILEGKFVHLLRTFAENNNNRIPEHIIVYRDGVSDSEMLRVSHDELKSLKNEVDRFIGERGRSETVPKYTFIVIQKRHKTRLFRKIDEKRPINEEEAKQWDEDMKESDKSGIVNPSSGTTVDKTIVSKYKFDFFLASHHGALGTSRPGHYTVMYDDSNLTQDQVYKMSYELAFLSARCRKPISLPAPVHYAHLSCEKAKEIYKSFKVYKEQLPHKPSRHDIENYLQTNNNYPGMSFA
ncbi:CBN-RDE-1 protein [Caenorhabditis brenneri]|uniref:CBN-RDE-1 protein n=1 Tax=Caenorhabditis brenneri TaxID=135651 RepID=G0NYX5_CAEBE|nr:CBN-RDE-1 protein [Caenorhabditis brenneri]